MTDVSNLSVLVILFSQILLDVSSGHPVEYRDDATHKIPNRFERSLQPLCARKKYLSDKNGTIVVNAEYTHYTKSVSCSWKIHVPRRPAFQRLVHLRFTKFNIDDSCPGICQCNYVAVVRQGRTRPIIEKFCNENKPSGSLIYPGNKVRIHLRLKARPSQRKTISFQIKYIAIYSEKTTKSATQQQSDKAMFNPSYHDNDESNIRVRKLVPSAQVTDVMRTVQPTQDPGPSKLTILLAVAVPVVLIFILVVLLIAYYNYYTDKKEKEGGDDVPKNGTTIGDLIMNSSVTLTPMFNLGKARRESSVRREKANKLYDDMLQNWRQMNANKKKREKAKEESVNTWESYKKYKQRRNTRDVDDTNSEAFAMLVSNAINVATNRNPHVQDAEMSAQPDIKETIEEVEEKSRTSSILVRRDSSDNIRHSRGSKVLSWSDTSTTSPKEDKDNSQKRTKSETELKIQATGSGESVHIPAIVVSQPSIETEDDESEANDTERLIKDNKDDRKKSTEELSQAKNPAKTYSCSEHVKDILRDSYGEEVDEWFQKPKKSPSQSSLQHVPDSNIKYQAMKAVEDDDDID